MSRGFSCFHPVPVLASTDPWKGEWNTKSRSLYAYVWCLSLIRGGGGLWSRIVVAATAWASTLSLSVFRFVCVAPPLLLLPFQSLLRTTYAPFGLLLSFGSTLVVVPPTPLMLVVVVWVDFLCLLLLLL